MSREAVVLRVDAGYSFGWDAWNRCQVLAYGLQRRRRPCYFLSHLEPNGLALSLKRSGHDWLAAEHPAGSPGDLEQLLRELRRLQAVAVIVDAAAIGPDYLAELAAAGILVVSVDTRAGFRSPAHLVLNPTLNRSGQEYEVCGDGQVLCGPRYVLVRPEIKRVRPQRSLEPPEPTRVVVALGDDQAKLSQAVVKTLLGMKTIARIEVLTWAHHPCVTALQSCLEKEPERITLATEPSSWGLAMMRSHLAIAASGPWALELAYVGVPTILISDHPEQERTAETLQEEGIARYLGHAEDFSPSALRAAIEDLLSDAQERHTMSRLGRAYLDGRGIDRFVQAIEILLHAPARRQSISQAA
jgi:spore coat polysaccharide biosynthesis predicted glycosyltransferase SpsG